MTPQEFIQKWGPGGPAFALNERQGAQTHFMDLCALLDVPTPGSQSSAQGDYMFEQDTLVLGQARGYADVFKRDCFAWENKAPGRNLDEALKQLLTYSLALSNPPLLVVCDRLTLRIHTQFNGHPSVTHTITLNDLALPEKRALLRRAWTDPQSFRPKITSRDITEAAAKSFATLAEQLRKRGNDADPVAHFLTQCLFCFFAEDVGLLPGRMFERLMTNRRLTSTQLCDGLKQLFVAMRDGGMFGSDDIPWFNGGLFKTIAVPKLEIMDITELRNAALLNWSAIDVSIFGTLFERGLDPAKRSQLGAHYTDPATIMRLVVPVLQRPLLQLWEQEKLALQALMAKVVRQGDKHYRAAKARFVLWLEQLKNYRVLDPACGSGNFLFLGLKALKDIEHQSHIEAAALGLDREADLVTGPHNVLGIELNEYAAELARVTVWIGELQWRLAHGYEFKTNPVLEPLDNIECRDALLTFLPATTSAASSVIAIAASLPLLAMTAARQSMPSEPTSEAQAVQRPGAHALRSLKSPPTSAPPAPLNEVRSSDGATTAVEATWPKASVVIGNPPFLGDKKMRAELGDEYTQTLRKIYEGRVPGGADLVCYWFEKARHAIETQGLGAAGLVATNSIRGGKNRAVLDAIVKTTRIYDAWSDEAWVNEGAAVRVSLIAMGWGQCCFLNGNLVAAIHADLSEGAHEGPSLDLSQATAINNSGTSFIGTQKGGPFEIRGGVARNWLRLPNPHGRSNSLVLAPWINGLDITRRPNDLWIVDFDEMDADDASLFELPWLHCDAVVRPTREGNREHRTGKSWWKLQRARSEMKAAILPISRYLATARVSKYRLYSWQPAQVVPDSQVVVIARADDTTFGILHSRFHELWSLRMGTSLEDRPRYTPTTCFETFRFPTGLAPADTAHQRTVQLEGGALIPADLADHSTEARVGRRTGAISKSEAYEPTASAPPTTGANNDKPAVALTPSTSSGRTEGESGRTEKESTRAEIGSVRTTAEAIARAAYRLNALREAWLNPPEWTRRVPEVIPLGMEKSPYPDRIEALPGHEKELAERTLTKLYNQHPAWLDAAHKTLDAAVAAAYGWTDYTPTMSDEEILKRLLVLNLARSNADYTEDTTK